MHGFFTAEQAQHLTEEEFVNYLESGCIPNATVACIVRVMDGKWADLKEEIKVLSQAADDAETKVQEIQQELDDLRDAG